jgi:hypothetical protein
MSKARVSAKKSEQLELNLPTWGGKRKGAGRKRIAARASVPHRVRPCVSRHCPVLITVRFRDDVPDVTPRPVWSVIVQTLREFRGDSDLQLIQYSVLGNHGHFVGECEGRDALSSGMRRLSVALARALNRHFGRTGPVFAGRYHARELKTPTEVRNALR